MTANLIRRYIWLVKIIGEAGSITLEEINRRWKDYYLSDGHAIPRKTFQNHRDAIEALFGIIIDCERKGGYHYYIASPTKLRSDGLRNWMLDTFILSIDLLQARDMSTRILTDDIPSGQEYLATLIEAMRENKVVALGYHDFWKDVEEDILLAPYCLKAAQQRWYVCGKRQGDGIVVLALDRMTRLSRTDTAFHLPEDFDGAAYFREVFGARIQSEPIFKPQEVVIRVYGRQVDYLRSLPIHHSQREVSTTNQFADFRFFLRPTWDFEQEIMKHGADWQVLSPAWLIEDITGQYREVMERYRVSDDG